MHFEKMAAGVWGCCCQLKQRAIAEGWASASGSQFVREWEKRIQDTQLIVATVRTVEASILHRLVFV